MQSRIPAPNTLTKLVAIASVLVSSLLFSQSHSAAAAPAATLPNNPNQIALLRWYRINQEATFPVGQGAGEAVYDGSNMWISNFSANTVTKIQASDGALLGTFDAGNSPAGMAFDGAHIWVADQGSSSVSKIRASDGKRLRSFTVGSSPFAVAFDGVNIWVSHLGSNNVTKLRASAGP